MKRLRKILKPFLIAASAVLIADACAVGFFAVYRPNISPADAVVVLGAAINTPALYHRSLEGLEIYQSGKAKIIVASGGRISNKDISEAGYIAKVIQQQAKGVPIILEDQSRDTYENLINTRAKIGAGKSLIIVSDNFHMARSVLLAKRLGFKPVYWSSPNPDYFSVRELGYYFGREILAMIYYLPKLIFA